MATADLIHQAPVPRRHIVALDVLLHLRGAMDRRNVYDLCKIHQPLCNLFAPPCNTVWRAKEQWLPARTGAACHG